MEVPRRLRFAIRRYRLDQRRVLDLGCGPGLYLRHFGPGSVGLDLNPKAAQEAALDARRWDFTEGLPDDIGGFDAIWCSNLGFGLRTVGSSLIRPETGRYVRFRRDAIGRFLEVYDAVAREGFELGRVTV